jgi:RNA polymerase sigma factor (sigma-70 family)
MAVYEDETLFMKMKEGNKKALSILFRRHYDYLLHYGLQITPNHIIVEESIQELFLYIYENHQALSPAKNVKSYLFTSLRRRIFKTIKKESKAFQLKETAALYTDIQFKVDDFQDQLIDDLDSKKYLVEVLNSLPWRQREAIYLKYYNGLSTKEIAEVMGVSNQTVLNTLYQTLKKIRNNKKLQKVLLSLIIHSFLSSFVPN